MRRVKHRPFPRDACRHGATVPALLAIDAVGGSPGRPSLRYDCSNARRRRHPAPDAHGPCRCGLRGTLLSALPDEAAALSRKARRRCKRQGGTVCSSATTKARCCTAEKDCLTNGSCALTCEVNGTPCPKVDADCSCGQTAEGGSNCRYSVSNCSTLQTCTSTADCPLSQIYQNCPNQSTDKRCVAICGYACTSDAE